MTYDAALKIIHSNNWSKCTVEEKKDALQTIEDHISKEQGRTPVKLDFQRNNSDELGAYDFFQSKGIVINETLLETDSSQTAVTTVLHEGYHAYQDQLVNGIVDGSHPNVDLWKDSLGGRYISHSQSPRGYEEQALERDACEYTEKMEREIRFESDCVERGSFQARISLLKDRKKEEETEEKYQARRDNYEFQTR